MANPENTADGAVAEHETNQERIINSELYAWLAKKAKSVRQSTSSNFEINLLPSEYLQLKRLLRSDSSITLLEKTSRGQNTSFALLSSLQDHVQVAFDRDSHQTKLIFSPAAVLALSALEPLFVHDANGQWGKVAIDRTFCRLPELKGVEVTGKQQYNLVNQTDDRIDSSQLTFTARNSEKSPENRITMFELLSETILSTDTFLKELLKERINQLDMISVLNKMDVFGFSTGSSVPMPPDHILAVIETLERHYLSNPNSPGGREMGHARFDDNLFAVLVATAIFICLDFSYGYVMQTEPEKFDYKLAVAPFALIVIIVYLSAMKPNNEELVEQKNAGKAREMMSQLREVQARLVSTTSK